MSCIDYKARHQVHVYCTIVGDCGCQHTRRTISYNEINVMSLFNIIPRTKRSHGHKGIQHPNVKKSSKPRTLQATFNDLLSNIQKPLGIHHIRTILFSLPVNYLKDLRDFGLDKGGVDPFSPKYRLSSIICDVGSFRLFKPVRSEPLHDNNRKFLHIPFANKGIDAINISNILNRKEVVKEIPPYFKNQSVPIVSYSYTNSIGRKMFNYKEALQDINIEEYLKNPLTCDCSHSPFQYNPSGHVITGDLNIIQHESLRKVISHGPKFREPQHINWKHNFKIIMDAVEDYARRWIKREVDQDPELESLSDWVRTIRSLVQGRIHKLKNVLIVDLSLYLKTKKLLSVFPLFMTNMLSFLLTRLPTISCLYVNHITSNA